MSGLIRVGVLDEQEVVRYGLCMHLAEQPGIAVSGAYSQADNVLQAVEQGEIDLLLMGYILQDINGQCFIKALKDRHPQLRILAFLTTPCPVAMALLLDLGVHGIVSKYEPLDVCVRAIRLLAVGRRYLCESSAVNDANSISAEVVDAEEALIAHPLLSQREREVLRLCINGLTVTRIAEMSSRSLKTVSTQKQSAYRKLGLKSDIDLFKRLSRYSA
ncbi:response regulator transcription factor [Pseudomonas marginalis]|nr:response regulator transcription factor [Pseudomonas marginalis]